jgi:CheY-like chemotaxis protein
VTLNLLSNAVKFTKSGEVVLRVRNRPREDGRIGLQFSVRDTGIGIPEERRHHLFDSFTQVDSSTTRKFGGTGLGLAISKQLVELMGGTISVESKEDIGSTFRFSVILGEPREPRSPSAHVANHIAGLRVLIVDDNATNRKLVRYQLDSWGCKFAEAEDGKEALELIRSKSDSGEPFDLAVLDYQMPGMDGAELAKKIKADKDLCDLPLILLTSVTGLCDSDEMEEIGFAGHLIKPIKQSMLFDSIARVFQTSASQEEVKVETPDQPRDDKAKLKKRSKMKLLVAEDNAVNQKVATRILKKLGFASDVVANGKEAIEALDRTRYDVVLMDCQMPEMDGFEATRVIRGRERSSGEHLTIIAMTANAMAGDREQCLEAGMDDYIAKPVSPKALDEIITKWTSEKARRSEPLERPLDREALNALRKEVSLRGGSLEARIDAFLEEGPKLLKAIEEASLAGDLGALGKGLRELEHRSQELAALPLERMAFEVEMLARASDTEALPRAVARIGAEYERVRLALERELEGN